MLRPVSIILPALWISLQRCPTLCAGGSHFTVDVPSESTLGADYFTTICRKSCGGWANDSATAKLHNRRLLCSWAVRNLDWQSQNWRARQNQTAKSWCLRLLRLLIICWVGLFGVESLEAFGSSKEYYPKWCYVNTRDLPDGQFKNLCSDKTWSWCDAGEQISTAARWKLLSGATILGNEKRFETIYLCPSCNREFVQVTHPNLPLGILTCVQSCLHIYTLYIVGLRYDKTGLETIRAYLTEDLWLTSRVPYDYSTDNSRAQADGFFLDGTAILKGFVDTGSGQNRCGDYCCGLPKLREYSTTGASGFVCLLRGPADLSVPWLHGASIILLGPTFCIVFALRSAEVMETYYQDTKIAGPGEGPPQPPGSDPVEIPVPVLTVFEELESLVYGIRSGVDEEVLVTWIILESSCHWQAKLPIAETPQTCAACVFHSHYLATLRTSWRPASLAASMMNLAAATWSKEVVVPQNYWVLDSLASSSDSHCNFRKALCLTVDISWSVRPKKFWKFWSRKHVAFEPICQGQNQPLYVYTISRTEAPFSNGLVNLSTSLEKSQEPQRSTEFLTVFFSLILYIDKYTMDGWSFALVSPSRHDILHVS